MKNIKIAVAGGKGGTGKTTVAVNLAITLSSQGRQVCYVDCDAEEPNGHIFLKPIIRDRTDVNIPSPRIDEEICILCGDCAGACRFSAITVLPNTILTFPALCHGCGACLLACDRKAIEEIPRKTGMVETGKSGRVSFIQGRLKIGEPMAPPVIRTALSKTPQDIILIFDAPPGNSCPVIETIRSADIVLLVTEPTPFGLHDLKLSVELNRMLGIPIAVAVNRDGCGDDSVIRYCLKEKIPVVLRIPDDMEIARAYSKGEAITRSLPHLKPLFSSLYNQLLDVSETKQNQKKFFMTSPFQTKTRSLFGDDNISSEITGNIRNQDKIRELVVVSGKGGTGKTSIVSSFFTLAENAVVADCDVDASDLHLVLSPKIIARHPFRSGAKAYIMADSCTRCGLCRNLCRYEAIHINESDAFEADFISCEGCGVCEDHCPEKAITMVSSDNGEWYESETRYGPMIHAALGIGQDNSGKLVSLVRKEAKKKASMTGRDLILCDASPGTGCPVIASITGADMVLIVTEPTLSGRHDFLRISELCRKFGIEHGICVNKTDINHELTKDIENLARNRNVPVLGRIKYDKKVTKAQIRGLTVVESSDCPASYNIINLWKNIEKHLKISADRTTTEIKESDNDKNKHL